MDWSSIAERVMSNYDSTWMDGFKKSRGAKKPNPNPEDDEGPPLDNEPDLRDDPEYGRDLKDYPHENQSPPEKETELDEKTRAELLKLLSD